MKKLKLKELKKLKFEAIKKESLTTIKGGYEPLDVTFKWTYQTNQADMDYAD